ncbi:MAG: hypothetical protein ACLGIN_18145 [Candidatus Sericytochromatia bacterium]
MTDDREQKNKIQCIVDEGIVVNRRDMVRILRDLGHVRYTDFEEDQVRTAGEGYVTSVFANFKGSTIIVNKRLYINVNSFSYLRLSKLEDDTAAIDLVDDQRRVRLVPVSDPLQERQAFMAAEPALVHSATTIGQFFGEDFADVYMDEDEELDEG